jgi:hypothetical protein
MRLMGVVLAGVWLLPVSMAYGQERIDKAEGCGLVVDKAGNAMADVTLSARAGDFNVTAASLSDGSFSFSATSNRPITLQAEARGFATASEVIQHLGAAPTSGKCKHPIYVVLVQGNMPGTSIITLKKKNVPKPGKR